MYTLDLYLIPQDTIEYGSYEYSCTIHFHFGA